MSRDQPSSSRFDLKRSLIAPMLRRLLVISLLLLAAGALGGWWVFTKPLQLPRSPYSFEVRSGATLTRVARELAKEDVILAQNLLVWPARITGRDRLIKAGNYEIEQGISLKQLLAKLTAGDVTQTALTVVEGWSLRDLKQALRDEPRVVKMVVDLPEAELLRRLDATESNAEGLFFPDTYFFASGSSDLAVLSRAYRMMQTRLAAAWANRAPGLPLASSYEALILASIVEKETGRPADRPLIASVFVNRLRQGMRLQTDPAVIYGLGRDFNGNLRRQDLDADQAYNTYTRDGLPPTPIALPSQAAIDAVLHPPATPFLYFVSRGDGTSEFSATLAEHNRAVAKYQRAPR